MADEKKGQPLVRNSADEDQVAKAGTLEEAKRRQQINDLQWILSDRRGRRVLWRMMERCGTFSSPWDSNASQMGRKAAWQEVGQWVRDEITESSRDAFLQMMQEFIKENANA